jgi:hypothetical protein
VASSKGGGIYSYYNLSRVYLQNTIVAKNMAPSGQDLDAPVVSQGHNLIGNGELTFQTIVNGVNGDQVGTRASPINPKLGPLTINKGPADPQTETMLPLPGSPARGNGGKPLASTDQRGVAYPPNGPWDIGAVQVSTAPGARARPRRRRRSGGDGP